MHGAGSGCVSVEYVLIGGLAVGAVQWVPGVPGDWGFEHLARSAVETSLGTRKVRVCSKEDLIAMKRAAGRAQDPVDLEELGADRSP